MDNAATTYTIRPSTRGWEIMFTRSTGDWGYTATCVDSFKLAVAEARHHASESDNIFARKNRYYGRNAGAWHRISLAPIAA